MPRLTSLTSRVLAGQGLTSGFFYPMRNTATDQTDTTWRSTLAPLGYEFLPNVGIVSEEPITDMTDMFANAIMDDPDLQYWKTDTVTSFQGMFSGSGFNQSIANWNTRNVTDMSFMFAGSGFNQPIGVWDVTSVTNFNSMFQNAAAFDQNLSTWNVEHIIVEPTSFNTSGVLPKEKFPVWGFNGDSPFVIRDASDLSVYVTGTSGANITLNATPATSVPSTGDVIMAAVDNSGTFEFSLVNTSVGSTIATVENPQPIAIGSQIAKLPIENENPTFDSDTTGWTENGSVSISSGQVQLSSNINTLSSIEQYVPAVPNTRYAFIGESTFVGTSSQQGTASWIFQIGGFLDTTGNAPDANGFTPYYTTNAQTGTGYYKGFFTTAADTVYLRVRYSGLSDGTVRADNIILAKAQDKLPDPTYAVTPLANTVKEGVPLNFSVTTTNVPDGTVLYWSVTNSSDFAISEGTVTINAGFGLFTVTPTSDDTVEGNETFVAVLREESQLGDVVATSSSVTITDPISYALTGNANTDFGSSVAVNTSYVVVAAPGENQTYVYSRNTGSLIISISGACDSVHVSDDYLIIGDTTAGNARIYRTTDWLYIIRVDNPNTGTGDTFGGRVQITNNYAAVANNNNDTDATNSGRVYVYDVSTYTRDSEFKSLEVKSAIHTIANPNDYDTLENDRFGTDIALTDTYLAVSAPGEDSADATSTGVVYIYTPSSASMNATIDNPNNYGLADSDEFGNSLSIAGTRLLVGTREESDATGNAAGVVYEFNLTDNSLARTITNSNRYGVAAGDRFGTSVGIASNLSVVGAPNENSANNTNTGAAYVYGLTGNLVTTIYQDSANALTGTSVSATTNYVAVGIPGADRVEVREII
jgi:hypothetical protein